MGCIVARCVVPKQFETGSSAGDIRVTSSKPKSCVHSLHLHAVCGMCLSDRVCQACSCQNVSTHPSPPVTHHT
jgi:hypothetical protein